MLSEQDFIAATQSALEARYKKEAFFPYPWQFDELPADRRQRYWALKAIVKYTRVASVSQQLRNSWQGLLGDVAVEYADELQALVERLTHGQARDEANIGIPF